MNVPITTPKRSKHEANAAWDRIKDRFVELYHHENTGLNDTRRIIAQEYDGFEAEYVDVHIDFDVLIIDFMKRSHWYLYHIQRDDLQKKRKRVDAEVHALLPSTRQGNDFISSLQTRRERSHRPAVKSVMAGKSKIAQRYATMSKTPLCPVQKIPASLHQKFEASLRCFEESLGSLIHHWSAAGQTSQARSRVPNQVVKSELYGSPVDYVFLDFFLNGIRIFEKSTKQAGWRLFSSGSDLVMQCIKDRPLIVLLQFLEFYVEARWDDHQDIRTSLTKYFAAAAAAAMANQVDDIRYLSKLFNFWVQNDVIKPTRMQMLQLMSGYCSALLMNDTRGRAFIQAEISWKYVDIGCYDHAEANSNALLQASDTPIDIQTSALGSLSYMSRLRGDLTAAFNLVQRAILLCDAHPTLFLVPEQRARLQKDQARLLAKAGQLPAACRQFWQALHSAAKLPAFKNSEVQVFYLELKKTLEECDDIYGILTLETDYAWVKEMIEKNQIEKEL